jgi:two-component system LytT family response regulator
MLRQHTSLEVVGQAADGLEAVEQIRSLAPDLVFLDVQMPGLDGFGVIETVGTQRMPKTIFVTAYDQYAIKAFDVHALDYLLKPYDAARFDRAVSRAVAAIGDAEPDAVSLQLCELLAHLRARRQYVDRLTVRTDGRVRLVDVAAIDWIESSGKFVKLHVGATTFESRDTLSATERRLDPQVFVRVHRSVVVNARRVVEIQPMFHGEYVLLLRDGSKIFTGRTYRDEVARLMR